MDNLQYAREVLEQYLVHFVLSLNGDLSDWGFIEDGNKAHWGQYSSKVKRLYDIINMDHPSTWLARFESHRKRLESIKKAFT